MAPSFFAFRRASVLSVEEERPNYTKLFDLYGGFRYGWVLGVTHIQALS